MQRRAKRSMNEAAAAAAVALRSLLPMYLPVLEIYNGDGDDDVFTVPDQKMVGQAGVSTVQLRYEHNIGSAKNQSNHWLKCQKFLLPPRTGIIRTLTHIPLSKHPNYCSRLSLWKEWGIWEA